MTASSYRSHHPEPPTPRASRRLALLNALEASTTSPTAIYAEFGIDPAEIALWRLALALMGAEGLTSRNLTKVARERQRMIAQGQLWDSYWKSRQTKRRTGVGRAVAVLRAAARAV